MRVGRNDRQKRDNFWMERIFQTITDSQGDLIDQRPLIARRVCKLTMIFIRMYVHCISDIWSSVTWSNHIYGLIVYVWSILSWAKVGSLINKIGQIYGLSLIWSILVGQHHGPHIRYAVYRVSHPIVRGILSYFDLGVPLPWLGRS